jgi:hypothetical protein
MTAPDTSPASLEAALRLGANQWSSDALAYASALVLLGQSRATALDIVTQALLAAAIAIRRAAEDSGAPLGGDAEIRRLVELILDAPPPAGERRDPSIPLH